MRQSRDGVRTTSNDCRDPITFAQLTAGERHEHVFERCAVGGEQRERVGIGHRRRAAPAAPRADARRSACRARPAPRRAARPAAPSSTAIGRQRLPLGERELHDVLGAERGDQLERRAQRDHLAVIDDGDPVAEPLRLVHVVRREQHRAPPLLVGRAAGPTAAGATAGRARSSARRGTAAPGRRPARTRPPAAASARPTACRTRRRAWPRARRWPAARRRSAPARRTTGTAAAVSVDGQLLVELRLLQRDAEALAQLVARRSPSAGRAPRPRRRRRCCRPSRISIVVVLPAPLGPSSPKHSPARTSRSRPSTATHVAVALDEAEASQGDRLVRADSARRPEASRRRVSRHVSRAA